MKPDSEKEGLIIDVEAELRAAAVIVKAVGDLYFLSNYLFFLVKSQHVLGIQMTKVLTPSFLSTRSFSHRKE